MTSRHDRLLLHDPDSPSGTIRVREPHEVLQALPATSNRTARVAMRDSEPILFQTENGRTPHPSDSPPHPPFHSKDRPATFPDSVLAKRASPGQGRRRKG